MPGGPCTYKPLVRPLLKSILMIPLFLHNLGVFAGEGTFFWSYLIVQKFLLLVQGSDKVSEQCVCYIIKTCRKNK